MRDSYVFLSPQGIASRWTRSGDGNMGMEDYIRRYIQKCPGKAVSLEIIVSANFRIFNYRDPQFWELYKSTPAWEFARFLAALREGQADRRRRRATRPSRRRPRNLADVEASVKWTQAFLATALIGAGS